MVEVTNFLLRWLYLSNMIRFDLPEIQTIPQIHPHPIHHHHHHHHPHHHDDEQHYPQHYHNGDIRTSEAMYNTETSSAEAATIPPPPPPPPIGTLSHPPPPPYYNNPPTQTQTQTQHPPSHPFTEEEEEEDLNSWKQKVLTSILKYPPGTPRLYAIDSIRMQIVQTLQTRLREAHETIQTFSTTHHGHYDLEKEEEWEEDPYKDADLEILEMIERLLEDDGDDELLRIMEAEEQMLLEGGRKEEEESEDESEERATLVIDQDGTNVEQLPQQQEEEEEEEEWDGMGLDKPPPPPKEESEEEIELTQHEITQKLTKAQKLQTEMKTNLPQIVSTLLHSPPPLITPSSSSTSPLSTLRTLLLNQCLQNPNLGIELCWILEAEVGKAWKTLFEHRKQSGRRLLVVLTGEKAAVKAAVMAKIGGEKRSAFDLLQDAEQSTAYGYSEIGGADSGEEEVEELEDGGGGVARLPASLSLKRCSHFGDTMQFVDRLTQISNDLRLVPILQRNAYLRESLYELNRRIRRRMITRGDVSLDVEDNRGPHDWPSIPDLNLNQMIQYSVHFPLEPRSTSSWPDGGNGGMEEEEKRRGMMRVLNIVPTECRLLSSRERCPFLVHMEVVETDIMDGSDARLYASGAKGLGMTVEEAMGIGLGSGSSSKVNGGRRRGYNNGGKSFVPYRIPNELLGGASDGWMLNKKRRKIESLNYRLEQRRVVSPLPTTGKVDDSTTSDDENDPSPNKEIIPSQTEVVPPPTENNDKTNDLYPPRGGWQEEDGYYYPNQPDGGAFNPYEIMRQQELEQLHQQMQQERIEQMEFERNQRLREQFYQQQYGGGGLHHHQQQQQQEESGTLVPASQSGPPAVPSTPSLTTYSDLLNKVYGPPWSTKCTQIRQSSPYGHIPTWRLASFIMKAGEDIRREALMMQIISRLKDWFEQDIPESQRPFLKPYTIMCVGGDAGMLECLSDAKSVDEVKKETDGFTSLRDYFERAYGPPAAGSRMMGTAQQQQQPGGSGVPPMHHPPPPPHPGQISFEQAQDNFLRSLVGYSLVCYILQIKDRHNANILLSREGHLIHIDFGFVLGDTPKMGKVPLFSERAPFKLTAEFWDVIGGWRTKEGGRGVDFCKMFEAAFQCASDHADEIASLIEAAVLNFTRNINEARNIAKGVKARLKMRGKKDSHEQKTFIMELVNAALTSWGTSTYDWLQRNMNGYQ